MAKYNASLVKEFVEELEKVPMIRQACSKIGIDHSTVYRWMQKHPDFYSKVQHALVIGRMNVTDAAESVILHGIQNKEFRSAAFWLRNNEYRYMRAAQGEYHSNLAYSTVKKIEEHFADTKQIRFDQLFKLYEYVERNYPEPEAITHWVSPFIDLYCDNDPKLIAAFHSAYAGWKKDKQTYEDSIRRAGLKLDDEGIPFDPHEKAD